MISAGCTLADFYLCNYNVVVSTAVHLALIGCGVQAGDPSTSLRRTEVLVQSFTLTFGRLHFARLQKRSRSAARHPEG